MKPIMVLFLTIGVGVLAFYGGMQYQQSRQLPGRGGYMMGAAGGATRTGTGTRRMGNGQPVSGEIISMDNTSLTVKLPDGSSRIVLLSDKTIFNKTAVVEKSELKVGEKVGIFGTSNADGSVSAQNVQLNPQLRTRTASGSAQ